MNPNRFFLTIWGCLFCLLSGRIVASDDLGVENHAPKAHVSANSEYSEHYLARFATDGVTSTSGTDISHAWCVQNEIAKDYGEFVLEWTEPIDVAEIDYWGRTAFFVSECWKDYQVFIDDQKEPVITGTFEMKYGTQPIAIPKQKVKKLKLVFLNSYGGPNPGATEIQVFSEPLCKKQRRNLSGESFPDPVSEIDPQTRDYLLRGLDKFIAIKRFEINASHVYTYHYEGFRAGGGLYLFDVEELKKNPHAEGTLFVETPTGQILDADLSYDGQTVLFSWRQRESEGYHLWTINVDGTNLTQLTDGPWHNYNPCWLPDGDIAFLSSRSPQFAYCWNAPVGILHRMRPDGTRLIRLSDNYLNDFTPVVLDDGRIIYGRWEYVDRPAIPIQSLWTIHPDGTNLNVFYGNRMLSPATFMEARQIPDTPLVVCTMTGHNGPTRGAIGVLDRRLGVNEQETIYNITPEIPIGKVNEGDGNAWSRQIYSGPYPLDSERFLVSAQGPILVRTFELDEKALRPLKEAVLLPAPEDGMQYFCAVPVRPRYKPRVIAGNIESPDSERHEPYATIFLQDVYQGLTPEVRRGEVAAIRIVREMQKTVRIEPHLRSFGFQFPTISCGATYAGKMVLGDVPVSEDGSAYFKVGAGITRAADGYGSQLHRNDVFDIPELAPTTGPIYFIALDHEGRALQRMRSFTHLMPGERQSCVGCHESRLSAPILRPQLARIDQEPVQPVLPDWADVETSAPDRAAFSPGFDYVRIVQPIWDRYCVDCHHPHDAPNGIDLSGGYTDYFNVSYDVLASEKQGQNGSPYISWIPTYNGQEQNILQITPKHWGSFNSPLVELIRSGHPDEQGKKRVDMDDASRRKVYAWIDLNVPYYASSETSHPDALGCRRIYPSDLDTVLNEVASRRCAECHDKGNVYRRDWTHRTQNQFQYPQEDGEGTVPRRPWVRISEPELNPFLLAPLAKSAGGTERCGRGVFADRNDPDYRKILETFAVIQESLGHTPRIDMPGGRPAPSVCRDTY
ncbi:MAG: hypothetical protein LBI05_09950 [Planctomycetaceae bacterium]|jgi:hypothetical protein|nr:hypothetical protein [Planctomycetaceae bacterium]